MCKETLHLIGLPYLVSLCFALPFCSSSALHGSEAAIWAPRPLQAASTEYFMDAPAARPPPKNVSLIFVAGVLICFVVFIATYCIAYRTILARQAEWNQHRLYQDTRLEAQSSEYEAGDEEGRRNNGGLEASLVSSLPIVQYSACMLKEGSTRMKGQHELEQNVILWVKECAVCLSEFEEGEEMKVLPVCGHCFHKACINMWLFSHTTCPICRLPLRTHGPQERHAADPPIAEFSQTMSEPPRGLQVAVEM